MKRPEKFTPPSIPAVESKLAKNKSIYFAVTGNKENSSSERPFKLDNQHDDTRKKKWIHIFVGLNVLFYHESLYNSFKKFLCL